MEKFRNAMKKKEFRDLLVDYAKEIQDPENKKVRLSLERCLFMLWITLLMYILLVVVSSPLLVSFAHLLCLWQPLPISS